MLIALTSVCSLVPLRAIESPLNQDKLDVLALIKGYGYKYANLRELEMLCELFLNEPYRLAVPPFVGIPSANIQAFIKSSSNLDCAAEWQNIITHYFPTPEVQKQVLESKQYPSGFLHKCLELELHIKDTFTRISRELPQDFNVMTAFKLHSQGPQELLLSIEGLKVLERGKKRLMTRSSGKEDTKKLANAGGNETISNVEPSVTEIVESIGGVVSSYFGEKSLIQRLGAGDESLFELTPFTPVLLQLMIGEQDPQQLPKCGVMFTEEPEGGISLHAIKNNDGSIKTTGITVIQAAYGHNEGVVNSLIPVDTFYVTSDTHIYPIIRPKTYRVAPAESRRLQLKKNEGPLVTTPALTADALLVLKKFADLLEKHYQGPMDVEFVVNQQEKTIYLVQARPIVHKSSLPKPSYIINPDALPPDQKLWGSAIGVAGGGLRWSRPMDVIVKATIGKALTEYQDRGALSNRVTCAVVGEMAPSTSHEATTFRSEGKPVIYIHKLNLIEQWLKNPATSLVVSPQQGLVINWHGKEHSIEELLASKVAAYGWISYPVPPFMSVSNYFAPHLALTDEALISLLPKTVDAKQFMQTLAEKQIATPWKDYLQLLKTGKEDEVSLVVATLLYELREAIVRKSEGMILDTDTKLRISLLEQYALSIGHQIKATMHYTQTDLEYTRRLLPIHFLNVLLYQQPMLSEIVNGYSAATLIAKELAVEQELTQKVVMQNVTPNDFIIEYLKIGKAAFTPQLEQQWTDFVLNFTVHADKHTQEAFSHLILDLGKLALLPIWLHTSFAQTYKPTLSALHVAQQLVRDYTKEHAFLTQIGEKKVIIEALNVEAFGDPKKFVTQWHTFTTDVLHYFLSDTEFNASFKQASNFGKLAALTIMTKFVEAFDLSIKAITSRPKDKIQELLAHFKTMLDGYAALFKKWVALIPEGAITYSFESTLAVYIEYINMIVYKESFSTKDLQITPHFNVAAFTIGSNTNLHHPDIQKPRTLEDVFTMIHQNLLMTCSVLNVTSGIESILLPPQLQKAKEKLRASMEQISLIGAEFSQSSLTLFYNYPLREHSMQVELRSSKKLPSLQITLKFFGANESSRWNNSAHFMRVLMILNLLPLHNLKVNLLTDGITFEFFINEHSSSEKIWEITKVIATYSTTKDSLLLEKVLRDHPVNKQQLSEIIETLEKEVGLQSIFQDPLLVNLLLTNVHKNPEALLRIVERMIVSGAPLSSYTARLALKPLFEALIALEYEPGEILDILEKAQKSSNEDIRELSKELIEALYQHFIQDPALSGAAKTKLLERLELFQNV